MQAQKLSSATAPIIKQGTEHKKMLPYQERERRSRLLIHLVMTLICLTMVLPLLLVVSISLSNELDIAKYGYSLIPRHFSLAAYQYILGDPGQVLNAYKVSILVTFFGTALGLLFTSMLAYALSRRQYRLRKPLSFYLFFTLLFNGGLIPSYILITQYLHLQDTLLVLFVPGLVNAWNVLLMRSYFMTALPNELLDAAKIDGAGEWRIFFQIVLPLSTPVLATIGSFMVLGFWNDWFTPLLYINDQSLYPLQYLLYQIESSMSFLSSHTDVTQTIIVPTETVRMAMVVIAMGPIMLVFLYFQKYFVRGITLGGIKGD